MNIHEYQAKALLHEFGVPISKGVPVLRASDSEAAAKKLGGPIWVVKSQIHAGGRGKGKFKEASAGDKGGVRIAKSVTEVNEFAKQMLGATLVTAQIYDQLLLVVDSISETAPPALVLLAFEAWHRWTYSRARPRGAYGTTRR